MPNSLNYGSPLENTFFQRPERFSPNDLKLMKTEQRQVIFGTSENDLVELWIYNPDGSLAGHLNLGPSSEILGLATFVDNTGAVETLNIDLGKVSREMELQPGRYAMVANFFRNEIGSEMGNKLYISEISADRTELRLTPTEVTDEIVSQIFEFVLPSVPRQFAKGVFDQIFGFSLDGEVGESLGVENHLEAMNAINPTISDRINRAGVRAEYETLFLTFIERAHMKTLDLMAEDVFNRNIQQLELVRYVEKAVDSVIYDLMQRREYDPRLSIVS